MSLSLLISTWQVLEETGYDIKPLVSEERVIKVSIYTQMITLYIVHPVSEDAEFATRTRKEISVSTKNLHIYFV
jgi:hypothetical protein